MSHKNQLINDRFIKYRTALTVIGTKILISYNEDGCIIESIERVVRGTTCYATMDCVANHESRPNVHRRELRVQKKDKQWRTKHNHQQRLQRKHQRNDERQRSNERKQQWNED